uniref:Stress response protein NST1-like n=1 Tax=Cicer arietinum TaxID=3827 RepID=A0A1S2Z329_CICAR|nr:stress response protein NST1-like [Cicer arietinum]
MKIKAFNLCFLCALFLLSVVATETLKEGKQYTKESKKNVLVDKFDGGRKPIDIESFDQNKPVGAGNKTREERMMEKQAKQKEREAKQKEREAKQKEREAKQKEKKLQQKRIAMQKKRKQKIQALLKEAMEQEKIEKKKREEARKWEVRMLRIINKFREQLARKKLKVSIAREKADAKQKEKEAKQKAKQEEKEAKQKAKQEEKEAKQKAKEIAREEREREMGRILGAMGALGVDVKVKLWVNVREIKSSLMNMEG